LIPLSPGTAMTSVGPAERPEHLALVRALFREYASTLGFNLHFQAFDEELATLPGEYAPPRGCLLLAWQDKDAVGCAGIRPWSADTAELKRLYVQPKARALGLGRALAEAALAHARAAGYRRVRLDSLPTMERALALYRDLGFQPIPPYRYNPIPETVYLELTFPSTG